MAAEAGTDYSGVLCGRATWKEGIPVYAKQGREGAGRLALGRRCEEYQCRERRHQACQALAEQSWRCVSRD